MSNGCYEVPAGWGLVAFVGNQASGCPSGTTLHDAYEGPSAESGACACGCTMTAQPTCPAGVNVAFDNDKSNSCGTQGAPATMADKAACNADMYTGNIPGFGYESLQLKYTPSAATGGACAASVTQTSSAISYTAHDTVCVPSTEPCTGSECTPSFGAGYQVCIATTGTQPCPGTTFTQLHDVGGAATFTCTDACSCSVDASPCTGTVQLFTAAMCMGTELDVTADGTCQTPMATYNSYVSYSYTANTPAPSTCTAGGSSAPQNVALSTPGTICCAP